MREGAAGGPAADPVWTFGLAAADFGEEDGGDVFEGAGEVLWGRHVGAVHCDEGDGVVDAGEVHVGSC